MVKGIPGLGIPFLFIVFFINKIHDVGHYLAVCMTVNLICW